jgi:hypothetical protein
MSAVRFPVGDILSVMTGTLVARDGVGAMYRLCDYMTGDTLMTHQLPRAADEAAPSLRKQFPDLAAIDIPDWSDVPRDDRAAVVFAWLDRVEAEHGASREVRPLAAEDHTHIDPLDELAMVAPHLTVLPITRPKPPA